MLSITSNLECRMETTWPRSLPVSRNVLVRFADAAADAAIAALTSLELALQRLQTQRRLAQQQRALRRLSPAVLRDIGAPPEWINEAMRWREQQSVARVNLLSHL
jgi:hypothetical protein